MSNHSARDSYLASQGDDDPRSISLRRRRSLEYNLVKYLLRELDLEGYKRRMIEECQERTREDDWLDFTGFNTFFPSFPVHFLSGFDSKKPLHLDRDALIPGLFLRFPKLPVAKQYEKLYNSYREQLERPLGLVIPRRGIPHGWILHDWRHPDRYRAGFSGIYHGASGKFRCLEAVSNLIKIIKSMEWAP